MRYANLVGRPNRPQNVAVGVWWGFDAGVLFAWSAAAAADGGHRDELACRSWSRSWEPSAPRGYVQHQPKVPPERAWAERVSRRLRHHVTSAITSAPAPDIYLSSPQAASSQVRRAQAPRVAGKIRSAGIARGAPRRDAAAAGSRSTLPPAEWGRGCRVPCARLTSEARQLLATLSAEKRLMVRLGNADRRTALVPMPFDAGRDAAARFRAHGCVRRRSSCHARLTRLNSGAIAAMLKPARRRDCRSQEDRLRYGMEFLFRVGFGRRSA